MHIDYSVYPDLDELPNALESLEAKADYVQRICAAWDFHICPEPETFALFACWRQVFDRFPLPTSPAYHAFRAWFGWEPCSVPANLLPPTPLYVLLDQIEGRNDDPCQSLL